MIMHQTLPILCVIVVFAAKAFGDRDHDRYCEHDDPEHVINCIREKDQYIISIVAQACIWPLRPGLEDIMERRKFLCEASTDEEFHQYLTCFQGGMTLVKKVHPDILETMERCLHGEK